MLRSKGLVPSLISQIIFLNRRLIKPGNVRNLCNPKTFFFRRDECFSSATYGEFMRRTKLEYVANHRSFREHGKECVRYEMMGSTDGYPIPFHCV